MKKIFTLLFSLGLLTSAFAQSEHRQQKQSNTYQSSQNSKYDRQDNSFNTYSNDRNQQWNKGGKGDHDQYAYNRIDRGNDDHFSRKYKNERRGHDYNVHYRQPVRLPLIQIIFGIGGR